MVRELELTYECCHWHCSCGKCSAGLTVRGVEHGIYLDGNSFASLLSIPGALIVRSSCRECGELLSSVSVA